MKQIDRKTDGIHGLIALRLMLMILLSVSAIAPMIAQQELILMDSIGNVPNGTGNGEFNGPHGVLINDDGSFFVVDAVNDRVQKFDKEGNYVFQFGTYGIEEGEFDNPLKIDSDSQGNLFITDLNNDRVQKFDQEGNFILEFGFFGTGNGQLDSPTGIAIDNLDNVYVSDRDNDRIQKFDNNGNFIQIIGSPGTEEGQLDGPQGLVVDNENNVYVVDNINDRVQKFGSDGTFNMAIGESGTGDGKFDNPVSMAIDLEGNIYISDSNTDSIQVFDENGGFILKYATPTDSDSKSENNLIFDKNGSLYISDVQKDNVYIYTTVQEINLKQETADVASGSTVDFGDVGVGTTSMLVFTIENLGGFDLDFSGTTGSQVELSGDNTTDFTVTQTNVIDSLVGFSTVTFTVTYAPAALGSSTATLTINSNDEDEGTYTIDLTAMAVDITAPVFSSTTLASIEENTAGVAYTVATDDASATITLGTSKDESLFTLANENEISFTASPDFEDPKDGDANNDYLIDIIATDESGNSATLEVTITVTDANDNPLNVFNENKIGIYPNPAVEVVSIADASVKYAVVYNLMGAKVYAAELENGTLNVKSLRKGLYVLTLMDGAGNILSTNRLMKE